MSKLNAVRKFLKAARDLDDDVSVQKLQILAEIMAQPGIDQQTLIKRTGQTRSAVSKNIADWSAITARKQPGPNLVESRIDPMNRVIRTLHPTQAGLDAWAKLVEVL